MYERLLYKELRPTISELIHHCGNNAENFESFNSFLSDSFNTVQEIRFPYGKTYGWSITHRKGKKLICNVFAEVDSFTVMVCLTNEQFNSVYKSVDKYTQECINNRYPCSDGGWIHYRVLCKSHLDDIKKMIETKC